MTMGTMEPRGRQGRDADDWVERVRASSDIIEVVSQTVALKRVGRNMVGLCPFHNEKTPSFSVSPERQFYHCFSCKAGGDVFRYVMETERVGFLEAVELLSHRAGIPVPERRSGEPGTRRPLLDALDAAATAYEQWLADPAGGSAAREYLTGRGLTDATVRTFRLGVAPDGWEHLLRRLSGRFGIDVLVDAGLATRRDGARGGAFDRFRNRLMVPLVAPGGAVLGFGARALAAGQEPKYLNSAESAVYHKRAFLFGYEQARRDTPRDGELILVEGYFDVISMHQAGIRNVVATSGTALTPEHAKLLQRLVAGVVLTFDGDPAGQDATLRSLGTLLAAGLDVRVATLPSGEDPDVLIRRGGIAAWNDVRAHAVDPVDFVHRHGAQRGGRGEARERAMQVIVGLALELTDPLRLRVFLERASQVLDVPGAVLARAVDLRRSGQRSDAPIQAAVRQVSHSEAALERRLLQALRLAPERVDAARLRIPVEEFRDPRCRELADRVWTGHEPEDGAGAELDRELVAGAEQDKDYAAEADHTIFLMRERRLKERRRDIQLEIQRVQRDRPDDVETWQRLLAEDRELIQESRTLRAEQARGGAVLPPNSRE